MNRDHSALPFGALLGTAPGGIAAYSCDYEQIDEQLMPDRFAFRHYVDGVYTGYKWQCVEFARRWLLQQRGYVFDDVAMAFEIFRLSSVRQVRDGQRLPLRAYPNGARTRPQVGSLLIWEAGGEFENTGHVAVITEVQEHGIRIAEQNVDHCRWPAGQDYSRELAVVISPQGGFWIACSFQDTRILGWVTQSEEALDAVEIAAPDTRLFRLETHRARQAPRSPEWLNLANPDESAFVTAMGGHRLASREVDMDRYYTLSETAHDELKRASNELHALFMFATDHVLRQESLLEQFNIPAELWPRIRQSFANRNNQMITGRFDFCLSERGLRVYEYNADSASCYLECGKVQGRWAEQYGVSEGMHPGRQLWHALVDAWRHSHARGTVHVMQDLDQEETYHAAYMRSAMEAAGLRCKLIRGLADLHWGPEGAVLDQDGEEIRWVWKTWAWETALEQLRTLGDAAQAPAPLLKDVLLRPGVMVFEPLWTVVTSNKALLPVLSGLYPDNPYLLDSQFELTERLTRTGYVSKPIAGRCGDNVTLFDRRQDRVGQTDGRFEHQDVIYQELWRLPEVQGERVQLCTFTVQGHYAGTCIRVDPSPIITSGSDILPLRIVPDGRLL